MSEDCNKCSEQKNYVRSYTKKKKGESSSNRISKKSQFYTLRRYYQSFKKKSDIMVQRSWACVFSLDLALTDWDQYCLGCRPPLTV